MSQTDQAIASLRSSIDALNAMVAGLQAQAAGKADTSAVASLAIRVSSCEGRIAPLGSPVTAQGTAVSGLSNRITAEASGRADADMALAQRIGSVQCGLAGAADASATCTLTGRKYSEGSAEVHIKSGEAVELLRIGKFVFHGETARQIRAAQAVLRQAGAGQLEVVKRVDDPGSPFVVIDDQVFITEATIKSVTLNPVEFKVRLEVDEKGQYYAAGIGVGVEQAAGSAAGAAVDPGLLLSEIAKQIIESEIGADLRSRIAEIEKAGSNQGAENRSVNDRLTSLSLDLVTAKSRTDQRIEALQAQLDNLQGKVYS